MNLHKLSFDNSYCTYTWIILFPLDQSLIQKNFKTPFFESYFKFLPWGNWKRSRTTPKKIAEKIYEILGASPPQTLDTKR